MTDKALVDIPKSMKKKTALNYLTQIAKLIKSESGRSAIEELRSEIKSLEDDLEASDAKEFVVPSEIQGRAHAWAIFSDGACRGNPGPGSYAYLVQDHTGNVLFQGAEVFAQTTNNRMELSGAIAGLKSVNPTPMHQVHVYTDSKYIVDGMKSWVSGWKKRGWKKADNKAPENLDLWQEIDTLSMRGHTQFHWVKGHAGHPQNEYVDQLCNKELDDNGY